MKAKEMQNLGVEELRSKEKELAQEYFNLKFQLHTGRLENTARLASLRKDAARVKTLLQAKKG